ncbi:tryptophan synthase beta subunit-like PLP-dependent enzyme [Pelagophyceae sp. CCMP2097]|nr:tryptophan synthase beta subunit-like PLP-dependent enzyme [Pelagophyceae sp. CCMP2097]
MKYSSTRGGHTGVSFTDAVMMGLAPDGGLFVPESIPKISAAELETWKALPFHELSAAVIAKFVDPAEISKEELLELTKGAYSTFRHPETTPVVPLGGDGLHLLELFHGPTWAFKDVALQFLGRLFELLLAKKGPDARLTILGATSGDTGSSAIEGVRGRRGVECFILYPNGRTSTIQEAQMASVEDPNVHACALEDAFFDDCQKIVKDLFADQLFRAKHKLGAVNSINWARIVAQIVYYFYAAFQMEKSGEKVLPAFSVPTGNFGDVLAGWYAKEMGCPCRGLLVATNANDILARFFATASYSRPTGGCVETCAPSMDISVSSNFERFVYHCAENDAGELKRLMTDFERTGRFDAPPGLHRRAAAEMHACSVLEPEILSTIAEWQAKTGYVLDPHTAIGVAAGAKMRAALGAGPVVCLACAHHGKFPAAIEQALGADGYAALPLEPLLNDLLSKPLRKNLLKNSQAAVVEFLEQTLAARNV